MSQSDSSTGRRFIPSLKAWGILVVRLVKIFSGSYLLVTSAAGGVGGMITQLASREHKVTGLVGGGDKKEYVRKLGASDVYTYKELATHDIKKFDVIFVASGKDITSYIKMLNKNGKLLVYGFHSMVPHDFRGLGTALWRYLRLPYISPFDLVYGNRTISGFNIIHLNTKSKEFESAKDFCEELLETGNMPKLHKIHIYTPETYNDALNDLASGNVQGKIVIKF